MIGRLLSVLAIAYALGFALFAVALPRPHADATPADGVVVLTGGAGRIERGLDLMEAGAGRRMLVSGVDPDVRPGELAAATGRSRRLFRCCIDLGQEAVDTRSNAEETAAWVRRHGYRSIRLVTSDWHMTRARMELRHALGSTVAVVPDPVPTTPSLGVLFGEYNKYVVRGALLLVGADL